MRRIKGMMGLIMLLLMAWPVRAETPYYQASPSATEEITPTITITPVTQAATISVTPAPVPLIDRSQTKVDMGVLVALAAIVGSSLGLWSINRKRVVN